jgi:hypothetical protein
MLQLLQPLHKLTQQMLVLVASFQEVCHVLHTDWNDEHIETAWAPSHSLVIGQSQQQCSHCKVAAVAGMLGTG